MKTCEICTRPIDPQYGGCSEFCAVTSDKEKAAYKALQPGDYGVFPCPECGCPTEGDWTPGDHCYECDDKVHRRLRETLLREALPHVPEELSLRILAEIGEPRE